jgi:glycosyltransferase involved in cell wall biosynthesis
MACGVPVVVSDTAINREICGDAAFFVDPNDIDAVAAAICQAVDFDEQVQEKTSKGKELAGNYQWHSTADKLLRFVTQL